MSFRRHFPLIAHVRSRPRRGLAPLVCGLSLLLAGCQLDSSRPLLPIAAGEPAFGTQFLAVLWADDGPALETDGSVSMVEGRFADGAYALEGQEAWTSVSLHPVQGQGAVKLLQVIGKDGKETVYSFGRIEGRDLKLVFPEVGSARRKELRAAGLGFVDEGGSGVTVENPVQLWRFVATTLARDDVATAAPHLSYRLATTEKEERALRAAAAQAECLALAGHPQDPAVARLSGKHGAGRWMNAIDARVAEPVCRAAALAQPSASVRYALARALFLKGADAEARGLTDALVREGFGPALAMKADNLAYGRHGEPKDPDAARRLLMAAADRGSAMATFLLGYYDAYGGMGERDPAAAQRHFQAAMNAGVRGSATHLGILYEAGTGVPKDVGRALDLYRRGVEETDLEAHYRLGRMLYFGSGTEEDRPAAFELFEEAAGREHAWSAYFAGFMLARGQGVGADPGKAVPLLEQAGERGIAAAKGELGRMLYHGEGVTADRARGRRLLQEAVEAGDGNAKDYLAAIDAPPPAPKPTPKQAPKPEEALRGSGPAEDLKALMRGEPFRFTAENVPFMAGVATALAETCNAPRDMGDRWDLATFAMTATVGTVLGGKYSDPDLGAALGDMGKKMLLQGMGEAAGRQIPCGTTAEVVAAGILSAIRSNAKGSDGGLSTFVRSCAPAFDQRRCTCLANTARVTMPDIHRMSYHRSIIKQVIEGNPFIGLQIALTCGITEY